MKKVIITLFVPLIFFFTGCCNNKNKIITFDELNLEMIECPAGTFLMGSPKEELGRRKDEEQHNVTIKKPFFISKFEITQDQYFNIIASNPSHFLGGFLPVQNVSFEDAKVFCEILNQKFSKSIPQGFKFDLPTNEQWEYACRAGTSTSFNNGKNLKSIKDLKCPEIEDIAWYNQNSNHKPQIVGSKKPNNWGIYDMHGNICEWCINSEYKNVEKNSENYKKISLYKGGDYAGQGADIRSAFESETIPIYKGWTVGFRVALVSIED